MSILLGGSETAGLKTQTLQALNKNQVEQHSNRNSKNPKLLKGTPLPMVRHGHSSFDALGAVSSRTRRSISFTRVLQGFTRLLNGIGGVAVLWSFALA